MGLAGLVGLAGLTGLVGLPGFDWLGGFSSDGRFWDGDAGSKLDEICGRGFFQVDCMFYGFDWFGGRFRGFLELDNELDGFLIRFNNV